MTTSEEQPMTPTRSATDEPAQSAPTPAELAWAKLANRCEELVGKLAHAGRSDEGGMLSALPGGDAFYELSEATRADVVRHSHQSAADFVNRAGGSIDEAAIRACWAREAAARLMPGASRRVGDSGATVEARAGEAADHLHQAAREQEGGDKGQQLFERAREAQAVHRAPAPKRCRSCGQVVPP